MNKRTVSMIHQLCDSKENSLEKLSEKFKVSQRTIRNDLNLINDFLKENSLETVELMKGGVIRLPENFEKIQSLLSGDDFYEYKLSKEGPVCISIDQNKTGDAGGTCCRKKCCDKRGKFAGAGRTGKHQKTCSA